MRNAGKLICSSDLYVLLSILDGNINQSLYLCKTSRLVGICSYSSKWRHVVQSCSEMSMVMVYLKMTSTAIYCANKDYYKEEGSQGAVKSIQDIRIKQSTSLGARPSSSSSMCEGLVPKLAINMCFYELIRRSSLSNKFLRC